MKGHRPMVRKNEEIEVERKIGNYGLDGPLVIRNLLIAGAAFILGGVVAHQVFDPDIATAALTVGLSIGIVFLITVLLLIWSSKYGKIQLREELIDALKLRGDETVVDIGCGRGLLLTAVARRLSLGKVIGIDLWQTRDQSGNNPETTLANAKIEGVEDGIEIKTGDMRELPFQNETIDVVVSSLAIHNIPEKGERAKALQEIVRVLKPGGRVMLLDYRNTDEYAQELRKAGCQVTVSSVSFKMFPPVRIVQAQK